jgi:hypothetical protein
VEEDNTGRTWQWEHVGEATHITMDRRQREGYEIKYSPPGHVPSNLFPPGKPHLLKFPEPQITPPAEEQAFNSVYLGDILSSNHNIPPTGPKGSKRKMH